MKLWNFVREHMLLRPKQMLCEKDRAFSFEDAVERAEELAKELRGVRCCAILCQSEMVAGLSLLACFAAGVTALPLSARYGQAHCRRILKTISPDAIFTDKNEKIVLTRLPNSRYISPARHPALMMCTSGTTGKPKGIMLSQENILANLKDIADYFAIGEGDVILLARPLYHAAVLTGEFLLSLTKGAKICFYSGAFHPVKMWEWIEKYCVTVFCGTPTLLSMMARFSRGFHTESLRHICVSGECMSAEIGRKLQAAFPACAFYHVYGLTEAGPRVSYLPPNFFGDYPDCVGIPLKSVCLKILNQMGEVCQKNEEGVLYVKGDNVMLGYYREPQKTVVVCRDGWLCTGDIALFNDAGFLKIKGRADDLIIKAGMNIYPAEIESVLKQNTRVVEALVYGFRNQYGTQIGLKMAGDFSSVDEVKRFCLSVLPPFQVPSFIELLESLPKNASGKVMRRHLR